MKWKRLLINILAYLLSIIIIGSLLSWCWLYLVKYEEYKAVDILASREADLGIPVYAQFSLSQAFEVQPEAEATKLVLPLYLPDDAKPVLVSLAKDNNTIATWNLDADGKEAGIYNIDLTLTKPTTLVGKYIIKIDGRDITHEDKDKAPRVFVEKDDGKYTGGNYFIADNKKDGDISLQVIGQRMRWQKMLHEYQIDPLQGIITLSTWLLLFVTAGIAPHVLFRQLGKNN